MRAVALALCLTGCSLGTTFHTQPRPSPEEGEWAAKRDASTRSAKLYDGLGANAFVSAVYLPRDVREAKVRRLAKWKAMTAEERDRLLAAEQEEAAQYEEFLVSLFTPDRPDNDLDAPRSIWRVALVVSQAGEALPQRVEQQRADATLRTLFPLVGDYDVVYRVRFARSTLSLDGRPFTFRMAGARGRVDLEYKR